VHLLVSSFFFPFWQNGERWIMAQRAKRAALFSLAGDFDDRLSALANRLA
jgi:hypothetical protein